MLEALSHNQTALDTKEEQPFHFQFAGLEMNQVEAGWGIESDIIHRG